MPISFAFPSVSMDEQSPLLPETNPSDDLLVPHLLWPAQGYNFSKFHPLLLTIPFPLLAGTSHQCAAAAPILKQNTKNAPDSTSSSIHHTIVSAPLYGKTPQKDPSIKK